MGEKKKNKVVVIDQAPQVQYVKDQYVVVKAVNNTQNYQNVVYYPETPARQYVTVEKVKPVKEKKTVKVEEDIQPLYQFEGQYTYPNQGYYYANDGYYYYPAPAGAYVKQYYYN